MSLPRALLPLPLALACTPAPYGGSDGSDASAALDVPAPATTLPAATTTTGTTTEDPRPPKFDLPPTDPLDIHFCRPDAPPPDTFIAGNSELGPFVARRAYFDRNLGGDVVLLFLSADADAVVEIEHHDGRSGPIFYGELDSGPAKDGWLGTWTLAGGVYADSMAGDSQLPYTVTLSEFAGTWHDYDPADPPRLVGTLVGDINGTFDAIYCDDITLSVPPD
ncbi:hypothetical protein [Nannocystis sp. SCPEA4]|uniref:hypothetical protein n=1 Tax=Nannocystis sp. SCPEA4 TaxID=2996787 RepID=UPI00227223DF|nr:hypothetical protein [Nannocystis sp. SCPEA4]MCY1054121.1 hypothetical protein [Nannocystis sp. SCPEA4]